MAVQISDDEINLLKSGNVGEVNDGLIHCFIEIKLGLNVTFLHT